MILDSKSLYAFDIKGKLRVFEIQLNKENDNIYIISSFTGLLSGKLTNKQTVINNKKRFATLRDKAISEYNSLISKKRSEGYKTKLEYVEKHNTVAPNIEITPPPIHKLLIPQYNTNENWDELPMLANKLEGKKLNTLSYPILVQRKYDGVRCLAKYKGNKTVLISRGGNYYSIGVIENILEKIHQKYPHIIFDGELYNHDMTFEEISGACREGLNKTDLLFNDRKFDIEYHIYDLINTKDLNMTFIERYKLLKEIIGNILPEITKTNKKINVLRVPTYKVDDFETLDKKHNEFVTEGYEGLIARPLDSLYQISFRSNSILKYKKFFEDEFQIVGYKIDDNKSIGESFVFTLITRSGKTFNCRPKGSIEKKQEYFKNIEKLIGKFATVKYLDKTNTGLPGKAHVKTIRNYE